MLIFRSRQLKMLLLALFFILVFKLFTAIITFALQRIKHTLPYFERNFITMAIGGWLLKYFLPYAIFKEKTNPEDSYF